MRNIGVVTVARSDYTHYRSLLRSILLHPQMDLHLIVSGTHLSPRHGLTVEEIERDGFPIANKLALPYVDDSPAGIAVTMGAAVTAFGQSYHKRRPDILVLLGDRYEMFCAGLAALPFQIPLDHIYGGELTLGALDDSLRHGLTKMSHLHFVATEEYGRRVRQLGEEPWRITVTGASSLDDFYNSPLLSRQQLQERFGLHVTDNTLLVTFHPVTTEYEQTDWQAREFFAALAETSLPAVITMPNADTYGGQIRAVIMEMAAVHPHWEVVESLGPLGYASLMAQVRVMVGNSSSGLEEAPTFRLPVVNVGNRQAGRSRAANVIDVGNQRQEIVQGIQRACSDEFRQSLAGLVNPFADGKAGPRILKRLSEVALDRRLLNKRFLDQTPGISNPLESDCGQARH